MLAIFPKEHADLAQLLKLSVQGGSSGPTSKELDADQCQRGTFWVSKATRELEAERVEVKAFSNLVTYSTFPWLGLE